jgi:hypothetical protein
MFCNVRTFQLFENHFKLDTIFSSFCINTKLIELNVNILPAYMLSNLEATIT